MRWTCWAVLWLVAMTGCSAPPPAKAPGAEPSPAAPQVAPSAVDEPAAAEPERKGELGLGFLLLRSGANPRLDRLRESAKRLGLGETRPGLGGRGGEGAGPDDDVLAYRIGALDVMVTVIPRPHPDAPAMPRSLFSPSPQEVEASVAHAIVAVPAIEGGARKRDATMSRVVAAVASSLDASGAMLGGGLMFYRADLFIDATEHAAPDLPPVEVTVDLTLAKEANDRVSIMTHGLTRYGREEIYVTHQTAEVEDALDFILSMTRWMVSDPNKQFPTGDTVGRTATERFEVQRMPSPAGKNAQVLRFDMSP